MTKLNNQIEKTNLKWYKHANGNVFLTNATINNPQVALIDKPEKKYELLYNAFGLKVEIFREPEPVGTYYKVSRGMVSFTTSEYPIVQFRTAEVLNVMIDDYIAMSDEDYSNAEFTEVEILN